MKFEFVETQIGLSILLNRKKGLEISGITLFTSNNMKLTNLCNVHIMKSHTEIYMMSNNLG